MEKDTKIDKNAQISAILYAFYALKAQKVVKTQREFANLVGINEQSLSAALRGSDRYLTRTMLEKIENGVRQYGVDMYAPAGFIIQGQGSAAAVGQGSQATTENSENVSRLLSMIDERDAQINRLLTLLENEQKKHM